MEGILVSGRTEGSVKQIMKIYETGIARIRICFADKQAISFAEQNWLQDMEEIIWYGNIWNRMYMRFCRNG